MWISFVYVKISTKKENHNIEWEKVKTIRLFYHIKEKFDREQIVDLNSSVNKADKINALFYFN